MPNSTASSAAAELAQFDFSHSLFNLRTTPGCPLPHTDPTAGQDPLGGETTLRDASSRATKAFYPALSMCDLIFPAPSSVIPAHPDQKSSIRRRQGHIQLFDRREPRTKVSECFFGKS